MSEIIIKTDDKDINILTQLAKSYSPEEEKYMLRTALVVHQTRLVADRDQGGNRIMRKLTPYEVIAHIETAKSLNLNPILNHLILLENQIYITLDGHLQNAHQSWKLKRIKTEKISEDETETQVREWKRGQSGKWYYENVTKKVKVFRYKCTIEKEEWWETKIYTAEWVADISNVQWGEKNSNLKLEQMAEARSMRRCLKRAFPVGIGSYEDRTENPTDFYSKSVTIGWSNAVEDIEKAQTSETIQPNQNENGK